MMNRFCLILILSAFLVISQASLAGAEAGFCETCLEGRQPVAKIASGLKIDKVEGWKSLDVPVATQANQLDAGFPMGCEITAFLYTLKFGPPLYVNSYQAIPGPNDVEKIRSLAKIFGSQQSRDNPKLPAFSERYGTSPNDIAWMFQSLAHDKKELRTISFLKPTIDKLDDGSRMLPDLHQKILASLSTGKPIIAQLLYSNPSFSHAIVITAIERKILPDSRLSLRIFDPMTGRESVATVKSGIGKLGDMDFHGLQFSDSEVTSQDGFLLSISL